MRTAPALTLLSLLAASPGLATDPTAKAPAPAERVIQMEVTRAGFVPAQVKVKAGEPLKLVVTRKVEVTCATEIVIKEYGINRPLPLGKPVTVTLTPRKPGKVRYACAMDMIAGALVVE